MPVRRQETGDSNLGVRVKIQ
ncbi:MAG: hypothetical protein QOE88_1543, partial [Verrucomicrobiota bacterium]|nr:hypothetical protein [Verrucomicrobiota bacterium]